MSRQSPWRGGNAVCVNVLKSLTRKNVSQVDEKEDDLDLDFEMN
ncbi:putative PTS system fructose-like transporter subunit EIIC [Salmonella enterica subsp. enterica]|uniref:Putative PTS system fructose-like transporter subunit EIIC n=1 Tax=Salmonella enterica I TaxID=59201 RepID=A0A379X2V7_SALET|nr:putative PTS system fructose-like transporter subunit EIIC [Salmonella enterica subsp. enterica]